MWQQFSAIMKKWSVDLFSYFLYSEYPRGPRKEKQKSEKNDLLEEYQISDFPTNFDLSLIDLEIVSLERKSSKTKSRSKKTDYEKEAKKLKKFGDRGEKIAMDLEIKRLKDADRCDLAAKVKRVSLESDSLGYDILSFDIDGTERFIEVKATSMKVGHANFYLSVNELNMAKELNNYYVYMIYDILSTNPKVWIIGNPFNPQNNDVQIVPINFKVTIGTK